MAVGGIANPSGAARTRLAVGLRPEGDRARPVDWQRRVPARAAVFVRYGLTLLWVSTVAIPFG
jgi:hypothetical protein